MDRFKRTLNAKLKEATRAAPERKRVMLYLDAEVYDGLKSFASKRGLSMNLAATLAVEAMIETEET